MMAAQEGGENDLFLASLAHELKTPLGAICGYAEMLAGGHVAAERVEDHAAALWEAAQALKGTVEAMLDFARLTTGELELDSSDFALQDCAEVAARTLSTSAHARNVELKIAIPSNLPHIIGDRRMMMQILTNLMSNAIKYGPEGGCVSIRASIEQSGRLKIEIHDEGPGISADEVEIAMQPFRRIRSNDTAPGHGLGLPLTKALVELHEGRFSLVGDGHRGTSAVVVLPAIRLIGGGDRQQAFVFTGPAEAMSHVNHF